MKKIIVKNIPEKIYKILESKAIKNNHTIDEEVLLQLNNIVGDNAETGIKTSEDWQKVSKVNRDSMKFIATEKELSEYKNNGRP